MTTTTATEPTPTGPTWHAQHLAGSLERYGIRLPIPALAEELARLDAEHRAGSALAPWPEYYAARLLAVQE